MSKNSEQNNSNFTPLESIEQAKKLSDEELLNYLLNYWHLEAPIITGYVRVLGLDKKLAWLKDIKNQKGEVLEYPFYDWRVKESLYKLGAYIGKGVREEYRDNYVQIHFRLSNKNEREKWWNPFLINCDQSSIKVLERLPKEELVTDGDYILLPQTAISYHIKKNIKKAEKEIDEAIKEKKNLLSEEENKLNNKTSELEKLNTTFTQKSDLISSLQYQSEEISSSIVKQSAKIQKLTIEEENLIMRINTLKDFIKERADWLHKLDLITDEVYESFKLESNSDFQPDKETIAFNAINNNFSDLVSYIHSYTFNKGIVYPRFLIEDFLTLLRTNDFIILSGLSGSGKTQIVKSFAEAMSGVAKVIPVKPNWTSSEDLLGFYNPLQRSYLTAPFLDALIEAERDPSRLHIICLDEMNLARVEYYFADFLSALENRDVQPEIVLYSSDEAEHVFSEFKAVIKILDEARGEIPEESINDFGHFLSNKDINEKLRNMIGINDNETFVSLHSRLRRMLNGILNVPSKLKFPGNVRIIGAINIDETTHYLSPKVLDRAHIIKFDSPLRYNLKEISEQITAYKIEPKKVYVNPSEFLPLRNKYPDYDLSDSLVNTLKSWANDHFEKVGVDLGLRTIRQSLLYRNLLSELDVSEKQILNNILRHKLLPRLSIDGNKKVGSTEESMHDIIKKFHADVSSQLDGESIPDSNNASIELERMIKKAENSDLVYNYWV